MNEKTSGLTPLGKLTVAVFIAGCLFFAWRLFMDGGDAAPAPDGAPAESGSSRGLAERLSAGLGRGGEPVRFGVAYGTEKKRWLEWAAERFADSDAGRDVTVELIPMGSLEGAQAILAGDERIHVWSPASAAYTDTLARDWQVKYGGEPFVRGESLALTPMVFVMWAQRYQPFAAHYGELSFDTVGRALAESSGWAAIAGKPEWGFFKFGHTHPNRSNSGLLTLLLMAHHHAGESRGLELADILDPGFQAWMQGIEGAVSGLSHSTGSMMREMVLKGPATYDALFVYESVVIDYLKNAEGRWGELRVVYPRRNIWNDNPYYVLDAPWSSEAQQRAAGVFLDFLLEEEIQAQALVHGFRPGNPAVPVRTADSPFTAYQRFGLRVEVPEVVEAPRAEIVQNLLAGWERTRGSR